MILLHYVTCTGYYNLLISFPTGSIETGVEFYTFTSLFIHLLREIKLFEDMTLG